MTDLELEETVAHIRQMRIESEHRIEDIRRIIAEHDRTRQEISYQPWIAMISGLTAGAAILAAGGGLATLAFHLLGKL
jgi:hypothetical protein